LASIRRRLRQRAGEELGRQLRSVDILAVDLDRLVGNDVGDVKRVLVALGAVGGVDIVDQAFVERPGIHLAFPIVDDRVAEAVDFRLLVGNAGLDPGGAGGSQRLVGRLLQEGVDGASRVLAVVSASSYLACPTSV
jgi:hypothetical protein